MANGEAPRSIRASVYIDGRPAENSLKDIKQQATALRRELDGLVPGTEAFHAAARRLSDVNGVLNGVQREVNGLGGAFGWLKSEIGKLGTLALGVSGFQFITSQFQSIIAANAKLSDSLADVRRVTGLTENEVMNLNRSFKELDTRTSIAGLRDIAIIAGKLGVAKNDILGFTEAVDKLVVTLGDELGNADQITTQLGKILNVYQGKVTGENITHLGNAIIGLANAGVASGGFLADFTQRVSGIAVTAHLSLGATLGLGAALEELGQKAESSSTAVTRLLTDIGNNLPKAAAIAKMPVQEFTKLFGETPEKALLAYAQGLVKNKTAFNEIAVSFKDAGEEGQRVIGTLAALGNKSEFVQGKIDAGNKLLLESGDITAGFALKNETFGATLDKLGKKFSALTSNSSLTSLFASLIVLVSKGIDVLISMASTISFVVKVLVIATAGYAVYNTVLLLATVLQKKWILTLLESEAVTKLISAAQTAWTVITATLQGRLKEARAAMAALNLTMEANPIGLVIAAIAALVTGLVLFNDTANAAAKAQQLINDIHDQATQAIADEKLKIELLKGVLKDENELREDKVKAILKLRQLIPDHLKAYSDEQILAGAASGAIDEYIKSLERRAEAEAAFDELKRLKSERAKIEREPGDLTTGQVIGIAIQGLYSSPTTNAIAGGRQAALNKARALAENQAQQDALNAKYKKDINNQVLGKKEDANTDPATKTVADRRKYLEGEIQRLKVAYDMLAETDKAGMLKNRNQREALQKEIDALDGKKLPKAGADPQKKNDDYLKRSRDLSEQVKQFNAQRFADTMAENDKEVAAVQNKYDTEIAKLQKFINDSYHLQNGKKVLNKGASQAEIDKHQAEIDQAVINKNQDVADLRRKQEEELVADINKFRDQMAGHLETELQREKNLINAHYDELKTKAGTNADQIAFIKTKRQEALDAADLREAKRLQDEKDKLEYAAEIKQDHNGLINIKKINKKYDQELAALKKQFQDKAQLTQQYFDAVAAIEAKRKVDVDAANENNAKVFKDAAIEVAQDVSNAVFTIGANNRRTETEAEIRKLEDEKEAKLADANLTAEQRSAINKDYAKKEADIKLQQWEADRAAAEKQAIIATALAFVKALPNFVLAGVAAAAGIAQVAIIASEDPPQFAGGGATNADPAGYVSQATLFRNSASGRPFVAGEAGKEWIAPNWMVKSPRYANIIGMLETARHEKRAFAGGGFNGTAPAQVNMPAFDMSAVVDKLSAIEMKIQNQQVYLNYHYFKNEMDKNARIENNSEA